MKSVMSIDKNIEKFPCLMITAKDTDVTPPYVILVMGVCEKDDNHTGAIKGCLMGTVVTMTPNHPIGHHCKNWSRGSFVPYTGTLTMSNE
jgi:hypothetical protein